MEQHGHLVLDDESIEAIETVDQVDPVIREACQRAGVQDASETLIYARALETIKNRLYEKKYAQLKARTFVPFSNEGADAGGQGTLIYRLYDFTAMAHIISNYATDFPLVNASAEEKRVGYHLFGNAFGYSILDMRAAAKAGVPLDTRMQDAARRGHEYAFEDECAVGVPKLKTFGLTNHPNANQGSLPNGAWSTATGEEMLEDLNSIVTDTWNDTLELYAINTILMSTAAFRKISVTLVNSAGGTMTVKQAFMEQNPGITIASWTKLTGAGSLGTGLVIAYQRDPEVMEFEVGREFEVLQPEREGLLVKFPCISSAAGLQLHIPLAVTRYENQAM